MNQLLRRLVVLQPGEAPALLASFCMLLCMFSSYTILRPVRDALGVTSGLEKIPYLFWGVFVVMLLLQPVYGWLTSRFPRTVFVPWVYGFFAANLVGFYLWFHVQGDHTWIARTYFVWVSVFNLFVVATFWSLMADVFTREQAGRVFGFIWAGASTGGLIGPLIAHELAVPLGAINLLPISAVLLLLSLVFMAQIVRWQRRQRSVAAADAAAPAARVQQRARRLDVGRFHAGGALAVPARHRRLRAAHDLGVDVPVPRAAGVRGQGVRQRAMRARASSPASISGCRRPRSSSSCCCSGGCSSGSASRRSWCRCRSS